MYPGKGTVVLIRPAQTFYERINLVRQIGIPNGLTAVGYTPDDLDDLVAGTLPQHRVTKLSPRPAGEDELRRLFLDSMSLW